MIIIKHNFKPAKFKWLWAKYVYAGDLSKHCTACIKGKYSKKFSGTSNKDMINQTVLFMDEYPKEFYDAIYFCGVVKKGYLNKNPQKNNYPHNVHFAVIPCKGKSAVWNFEEWHVEIENGIISPIPSQEMLDEKFFRKPYDEHFYTCRIFRWMVGFYYPQMLYKNKD